MNPQPLVGIGANHFFKYGLNRLRIARGIACDRDGRVEAQNVAALRFGPQRETRE